MKQLFKSLVLTLPWLSISLIGCHHELSQISLVKRADAFDLAKILERANSQGTLPESFVSVGIQSPDHQSHEHLVGGFLIHPGVVLTSAFKHPSVSSFETHIHKLGSLKPSSLKEKLRLLFKISKGTSQRSVSVKVKDVILHPTGRATANQHSFSLMFFDPVPELSHIKPLPLATTEDISLLEEARGDDMLAVGVKDYKEPFSRLNDSENKDQICSSHLGQLGKVKFSTTTEEYHWLLDVIHAFPGELEPYLFGNFFSRTRKKNKTVQIDDSDPHIPHILEYLFLAFICNVPGSLCTETSPEQDPAYLQFQCTEHLGYPLLWHTPQRGWRALGMSWLSSLSSSIFNIASEDKTLLSSHYDLIYAHSWIKSTIRNYAQEKKSPSFKAHKDVLKNMDHSLERELKNKTLDFDFLVGLTYETEAHCFGAFIDPGVVITAAHCLAYPDQPLILIFNKKGKIHKIISQKTHIHPDYDASAFHRLLIEEGYVYADVALIFFKPNQDFPNIKPASLAQESHQALRGAGKLWQLTNLMLIDREHYKLTQWPDYFLWRETSPLLGAQDYIRQAQKKFLSDKKRKEKLFALSKKLTKKKVHEESLTGTMLHDLQNKEDIRWLKISQCASKNIICLWDYPKAHRLAKMTSGCRGSSGSPLVWVTPQSKKKILGVLSTGGYKGDSLPLFCSGRSVMTRISSFLPWIRSTISQKNLFIQKPP